MLPLGDESSGSSSLPLITIGLIVVNVLVFVLLQGMGTNDHFTYAFSTIPHEILTGKDVAQVVSISDPLTGDSIGRIDLQHTPISVYLTMITSMFMHGGWAHLFGNMLFLYIFGDNVEQRMGSVKFLAFYVICGVISDLCQVVMTAMTGGNDMIPTLGASGAISGVLAAYLVLFPNQRVRVLMARTVTQVPAFMAIGLWFVFQLISGIGVLGNDSQMGGVAYAAHVGGFVAGFILVRLFAGAEPTTADPSRAREAMFR